MTFKDCEEEFNSIYFGEQELNQSKLRCLMNRWDTPKRVIIPRKAMQNCLQKTKQVEPEWVLQQALIILKNRGIKNDDLLAVITNDDYEVYVNGRLYDSIKIEAKLRKISVDDLCRYLTVDYLHIFEEKIAEQNNYN